MGGKYVADYSTPGSDSMAASDTLMSQYGGRTAQTVDVVYHDATGVTRSAVTAKIDTRLKAAGHLDGLTPGVSTRQAHVSPDGRTAIVSLPLNRLADKVSRTTGTMLLTLANRGSTGSLRVAIGGEDVGQATHASSTPEFVRIAAAMVALLIMFGGVNRRRLTLLTALFGLGISVMGAGVLAAVLPTLNWALQVAIMIGLGLGTGHALLILTRHKAAMARGLDPEAATAEAMSGGWWPVTPTSRRSPRADRSGSPRPTTGARAPRAC